MSNPSAASPVWYVLRTKPHKECVVARAVSALRVETYLPRIVERVRAGRHFQRRIAPMFPGYLFVRTILQSSSCALRYTPGARDFLRQDGDPQPVSAEIVATLRERIGPADVYIPEPRRFTPGERLAIDDGPLRGLEVIFERELSGTERVAVLLAEVTLPARVVLPACALARA